MLVAIVHYHFKRGGVTKVVENTIAGFRAYAPDIEWICFSGESYMGEEDLRHEVIPALNYGETFCEGTSVLEEMKRIAKNRYGKTPDLFHIHNHSLGKNLLFPSLLFALTTEKTPVVLHTHDFAEDARPANYQLVKKSLAQTETILYPISGYIHYTPLNQRDAERLKQAGIPAKQITILPNPHEVHPAPEEIARKKVLAAEQLTVFPVRGIRRKNIGELLLWASLAEEGHFHAVTLTPENPREKTFFDQWKAFSEQHHLPAYLGLADQVDLSFPELIASADRIMTTSIAEGFGLTFLEPWGFKKPLIGRSIPGISDDFVEKGMQLQHLYDELPIPLAWLPADELRQKISSALYNTWSAYEQEISPDEIESIYQHLTANGTIDFGRLDEELQQTVITHLLQHPRAQEELSLPNLYAEIPQELINHNYQTVQEVFSLSAYTTKLIDTYHHILSAPPEPSEEIPPAQVLQPFLAPSSFSLLRQ